MADRVFESISSDKVRSNIRQAGFTATRDLIEKQTREFADRGFDPDEIRPLIREGAKEATK